MHVEASPGPELRRFSGASAIRVIDASHAEVAEHAHDWPVLSLHVMGAYRNRSPLGEAHVNAPSTVFYAAGAAHANRAGPDGFEQIEIEFDPAWLGPGAAMPQLPVARSARYTAAAARTLRRLWSSPSTGEDMLRLATRHLLSTAFAAPRSPAPQWIDQVFRRVLGNPDVTMPELAEATGLHPGWLGQAYRAALGETVGQTATRRRVEAAARLLRETPLPAAEIAIEAGFCDQSHMIRAFQRTLGRTPQAVRADRSLFRTLKTSNP